jgi:hypothetical protein
MTEKERDLLNGVLQLFALAVAILALHLSSLYSYLFFHSLVEISRIVVIFGVFVLAWHSRRWSQNGYLTFVGIAYLFVGFLELLHALAYKGMGVFQGYDANLPTQLWVAFRYLESISLLVAAFLIDKRISPAVAFGGYSLITTAIAIAIFSGTFPDCFVEGKGLTTFKIESEYIISGLFFISVLLLMRSASTTARLSTFLIPSRIASTRSHQMVKPMVSTAVPRRPAATHIRVLKFI